LNAASILGKQTEKKEGEQNGKRKRRNGRPFQKPKGIGHPRDCTFGIELNFVMMLGALQ